MAAIAAPTSPRLPSPPPPAEIQLGPKSPGPGAPADQQAQQFEAIQMAFYEKRRIHRGSKAADIAAGPPVVPLDELDTPSALQEHLAALHYHHTASRTRPVTREIATILATPPPSADKILWLYELCRFLTAQCNDLIVGFFSDTPPCSAATCAEMRASEWQFLCAVHDQPKSCCAIDYCCHTLDWAANVVTSPRVFPARYAALCQESLSLGPGAGLGVDKNTQIAAIKSLGNVFRRLHRIFAHAWFQHRGVFWAVEGQTGLYVFFKIVCDTFELLPAENFKLPPEAEGLEDADAGANAATSSAEPQVQIQIQRPPAQAQPTAVQMPITKGHEDDNLAPVSRTNTRRHIRSSPSTGSAVATVPETDEDDGVHHAADRMKDMQISPPETVEEEPETADVPVIVDDSIMQEAQPTAASHSAESEQDNQPVKSLIDTSQSDHRQESDTEVITAGTHIKVHDSKIDKDEVSTGLSIAESTSRPADGADYDQALFKDEHPQHQAPTSATQPNNLNATESNHKSPAADDTTDVNDTAVRSAETDEIPQGEPSSSEHSKETIDEKKKLQGNLGDQIDLSSGSEREEP